ncbi:MAG: CPBP family intramembrane glutamic endopeptidase [Eubacteriales bacterium]
MDEKQIIRHYSDAVTWQQKVLFCLLVLGRCSGYLFLYFCVPSLFLALAYVVWYSESDPTEFFTYGGSFYTTMGMVASLFFLRCRAKRQGQKLVTGLPSHWDAIAIEKTLVAFFFGVTAALALSAGLTMLEKVPFLSGIIGNYSAASMNLYRGYDLLFTIVSTVLLAPVVEEVIFRGYVLDILLETFPERTALLFVTIGFAICHVNPLWVIYAAISGFLFCFIAIREDGIFYPVLCHIGFNLPSAIIVVVTLYVEGAETVMQHPYFLAGLGLPCCWVALVVAKHYARQSESGYLSIRLNWRHDS